MFLRRFVSALVVWCMFCASAHAAGVSSSLPLNSWVYSAFDRLAASGAVQSSLSGNRPYTRSEAARLVVEAEVHLLPDRGASDINQKLITRLKKEFADDIQATSPSAAKSYFKPITQVALRYDYRDGQPTTIPRTNARQFALDYNNQGKDYSENHNAELGLISELRFSDWFLFSWQPYLSYLENNDSQAESHFGTRYSKLALQLFAFEFSVGRQPLWWGRGRHGSLVLSNNAEPLDMLRVTNPSPIILPWIFGLLGPARLDVFWSRLETERRVAEPYFAGMRIDVKPLPWFELGASRCVIFGGEGRPHVDASEFVTILTGKNLSGGEDTSNSVAAVDFRLHLPFLWNAEFYAEIGGEDEAGYWIANMASLVGLYLPVIEPSGRLSLRLEYADLSSIDNNSPVWYRHGIYRSGYTYKGKILGHHVGGGAEDRYIALDWWLTERVQVTLGYDEEKRGYDQAVLEKHRQPFVAVDWMVTSDWQLKASYANDSIENVGYVAGADRTDHAASFSVTRLW
ncbi:MAG: capsule assembly Wzi family protein [Deltaproteobacteria bacterium]|nr:capsule assembly Wzi family protein [Deltaproteobacteria bacterium]